MLPTFLPSPHSPAASAPGWFRPALTWMQPGVDRSGSGVHTHPLSLSSVILTQTLPTTVATLPQTGLPVSCLVQGCPYFSFSPGLPNHCLATQSCSIIVPLPCPIRVWLLSVARSLFRGSGLPITCIAVHRVRGCPVRVFLPHNYRISVSLSMVVLSQSRYPGLPDPHFATHDCLLPVSPSRVACYLSRCPGLLVTCLAVQDCLLPVSLSRVACYLSRCPGLPDPCLAVHGCLLPVSLSMVACYLSRCPELPVICLAVQGCLLPVSLSWVTRSLSR